MESVDNTPAPAQPESQVNLTDIEITNENVALNILVAFVNVAHRRGAFAIDESSKIWECLKFFLGDKNAQQVATEPLVSADATD